MHHILNIYMVSINALISLQWQKISPSRHNITNDMELVPIEKNIFERRLLLNFEQRFFSIFFTIKIFTLRSW